MVLGSTRYVEKNNQSFTSDLSLTARRILRFVYDEIFVMKMNQPEKSRLFLTKMQIYPLKRLTLDVKFFFKRFSMTCFLRKKKEK